MSDNYYDEILHAKGFTPVGELRHHLHLRIWWHPTAKVEITVLRIGDTVVLKGHKNYYVQAITSDGVTFVRDIGGLHTWLEAHCPSIQIHLAHHRDIPPELAQRELQKRMDIESPTQSLPSTLRLGELQRELAQARRRTRSTTALSALSSGTDLASQYLRSQFHGDSARVRDLERAVANEQERLGVLAHLQRQYREKGSAACYALSISSNLQTANARDEFADTVAMITKELADLHRYEVMQRFRGGRLNIQLVEASDPLWSWVETFLGGALSPMQVSRLSDDLAALKAAALASTIVTPDDPIVINDGVRHTEVHLGARVIGDLLSRVDVIDRCGAQVALDPAALTPELLPLRIGTRLDENNNPIGPAALPLAKMVHGYVSGTTGSGKSFLSRVLIEEAAAYPKLNILVIDPRNQSGGILLPEDRPEILRRYDEFKMPRTDARGFKFDYCAAAIDGVKSIPDNLKQLGTGRWIVSLKNMDDQERRQTAAEILEAVLAAHQTEESEQLRLLIVIEEAHLFTRRRVAEFAKSAAARVERAIDRCSREARKFGVAMLVVSQKIYDFETSVRQMMRTRLILQNADRELVHVSAFIDDQRQVATLATGTVLIHNSDWGLTKVRVRPPRSKVFEMADRDMARLVKSDGSMTLGIDAQRVLDIVRQHASAATPLHLSRLAGLLGISSKRRLQELIEQLTVARLIHTRQLPERGRPRVVEVVTR